MAQYINGYSNPQMPPPFRFQGVRIWNFPVRAQADVVQALVNKFLPPAAVQKATGYSFKVLRGVGMFEDTTILYMMVLDYSQMACVGSVPASWGYLAQKEFYFGVPLVRSGGGEEEDIVLFTPYIFVDNSWSLICGNTVLGYPKQLAWFLMSPDSDNPYPIQITTSVFTHYSPATPQTWQRFVDIEAFHLFGTAPPNSQALWPFGDIDSLYGPKGDLPLDEETFNLFLGFKLKTKMSYDIVQLKQFRNAQSPDLASYQAIVTSTVELENFRFGDMLPPAVVNLTSYASLPLRQDLGLLPVSGPVIPAYPYWLECSFLLKNPIEQVLTD